jgi:hypothetical protein
MSGRVTETAIGRGMAFAGQGLGTPSVRLLPAGEELFERVDADHVQSPAESVAAGCKESGGILWQVIEHRADIFRKRESMHRFSSPFSGVRSPNGAGRRSGDAVRR